jgi:type VI secretion system protein ImpG
MRDDLLYFYERELGFLRRMGAQFADRYPKVAARLQLEPTKCEDPHVERLLEGFAFLAARVHLKLEDDFPEVSHALLEVVYPHLVRPIPSMSIVEMQLDPEQGKLPAGVLVPRDAILRSRPVAGTACTFRTCYDTTLWPVTVAEAQWTPTDRLRPPIAAPDAVAALRLVLRCLPDVSFSGISLSALRFHLTGESSVSYALYELLCSRCVRIVVREPGGKPNAKQVVLSPSVLQPGGFGKNEGMLPFSRRSFLGYRLLQEYFTFPDKFLFLELGGFDQLRAAGFGPEAEFIFLISPFERTDRRQILEGGIDERSFRLGCTPIVNLFPQTAEPILLTQQKHEYLLVPDVRRRESVEVFSVDEVVGVTPGAPDVVEFDPIYSLRHGADSSAPRLFWSATRRATSWREGAGSDVFLSFVDLSTRIVHPDEDVATVRTTCHNGDLPSRLPIGLGENDFQMEGGGPIRSIRALLKPTEVLQPPLGKPLLWRLISQLSLNYLSLVDGAEPLQEILRLHNAGETAAGERNIQGLLAVRSEPGYARVQTEHGISFARGRHVHVELDEERFTGGGAFLFASVLERFLGMYASMNSFTALTARTRQRQADLHTWNPRAGWKPLL